jgi:hypothetical protein
MALKWFGFISKKIIELEAESNWQLFISSGIGNL